MPDFWLGVLVTLCVVQAFAWLALWAVAWGPMKWVAKVREATMYRDGRGAELRLDTRAELSDAEIDEIRDAADEELRKGGLMMPERTDVP